MTKSPQHTHSISTQPSSFWGAFALGVLTSGIVAATLTTTLHHVRRKQHAEDYVLSQSRSTLPNGEMKSSSETKKKPTSKAAAGTTLMDDAHLDLRLIRKAEGVIRKRTSRVLVVVERCTNDHNYSAILRTVEALGVQHMWIISPPPTPQKEHRYTIQGNKKRPATDSNQGSNDNIDEAHSNSITTEEEQQHQQQQPEQQLEVDDDDKARKMHHIFARGAQEWLTIRQFDTTAACLAALEEEGWTVWATDLSQEAVCLTREGLLLHQLQQQQQQQNLVKKGQQLGGTSLHLDMGQYSHVDVLPRKLAIVFGTEAVGCTQLMLTSAHLRVYLPLRGYADSLNLSVAAGLVLWQLFCLAHPDSPVEGCMDEDERNELRKSWYVNLTQKRMLSAKQKRTRVKLLQKIQPIEELIRQRDAKGRTSFEPEQLHKMDPKNGLQTWKAELEALDELAYSRAVHAVQDLIKNPPAPLTDLRRPDEHRVCYVGTGTKKKYKEEWKDMAATKKWGKSEVRTAAELRARADLVEEGLLNNRSSET